MFKSRISAWGIEKKNKRTEAHAILREHRRRIRAGQPCLFVRRGWPVNITDIERFCKRSKLDTSKVTTPARLPSGIACIPLSSVSSTLSDPAFFSNLETLLFYSTVLVDSSFETGLWKSESLDDCHFSTDHTLLNVGPFDKISSDIKFACLLFDQNRPAPAGAFLRRAFSCFPETEIITGACHMAFRDMISLMLNVSKWGHQDISKALFRHVDQLLGLRLEATHPHRHVFQALDKVDADSIDFVLEVIHWKLRDLYVRWLGQNHVAVLTLEFEYNFQPRSMGELDESYTCHADTPIKADDQAGRTLLRRRDIIRVEQDCKRSYDKADFTQAELLAATQLEHVQRSDIPDKTWYTYASFKQSGEIMMQLGKFQEAKEMLEQALATLQKLHFGDSYLGFGVLQHLKAIEHHTGNEEEAARIEAHVESLLTRVETDGYWI